MPLVVNWSTTFVSNCSTKYRGNKIFSTLFETCDHVREYEVIQTLVDTFLSNSTMKSSKTVNTFFSKHILQKIIFFEKFPAGFFA